MSMYAVVDPVTGETLKDYPTITDEELRDAIARADRAHREWSRAATVADRASLLRRVGELHSERRKELAEIIVAEMGKPVRQARGRPSSVAARSASCSGSCRGTSPTTRSHASQGRT
jgi:succinate-semialdehyde dehydrogenase/glutarate-semialdehyde dehydrogenase